MKKFAASVLIAMGGALNAQPIVDIILVQNEADSVLEFWLRPNADFGGVVTSLGFTLRWDTLSDDVLGTRVNACPSGIPISSMSTVVDSGYYHRTFMEYGTSLIIDEGCPWTACEEHLVMTIPVVVTGSFGPFEIVEGSYYVGLGGSGETGVINPTEPCLSTGMSVASSGVAKGIVLFPNPATSGLSIALPSDQSWPTYVEVIAADGHIVRVPNNRDGYLDIASLAPGAYALRVSGSVGRFLKLQP
ncbi:MAG: T9SS type A sorting domain-containing protein [Flavobacteriales bacterium]|nr:T9SS type A sorting domain-containing protein [Flavobacteriales bacterium]